MNLDHLQQLMEKQRNFMELLGNDPDNMDEVEREDHISTMAVALADESFEILRETNWKPWKAKKPIDGEKIKTEIVDALHFILELAILSGMTWQDLYDKYMEKMLINIDRQKNGY